MLLRHFLYANAMHLSWHNQPTVRNPQLRTQLFPTPSHMLCLIAAVVRDVEAVVGRCLLRAVPLCGEGGERVRKSYFCAAKIQLIMERKEGEGRNQQKDPSFGAKSKENVS